MRLGPFKSVRERPGPGGAVPGPAGRCGSRRVRVSAASGCFRAPAHRGHDEPHLPRQRPAEQGGAQRAAARRLGARRPPGERYYVLYVRPSRIHRRKFDPKGKEIEPNFSDTRKVTTGFLMSSYKVEAKGDSDRLTPEELMALVNKPQLLALTESLAPDGTVAFWMPESEMEAMELELGAGVRLKTQGDGPFLESLAKLEAGTVTKCNFAGDSKTGASWTDNIMARKSSEVATAEVREQGDGAADEEWDD
uniref:Arpin n=1 Tax=Oryctolagus cuniculus TaxID=9986 RepID=A0A5F9DVN6_RABIT